MYKVLCTGLGLSMRSIEYNDVDNDETAYLSWAKSTFVLFPFAGCTAKSIPLLLDKVFVELKNKTEHCM